MTPKLLRIFAWLDFAFTVVVAFINVPKDISFMAVPAVGLLCYQLSLLMDRSERQGQRIKRLEEQIDRLISEPEATVASAK